MGTTLYRVCPCNCKLRLGDRIRLYDRTAFGFQFGRISVLRGDRNYRRRVGYCGVVVLWCCGGVVMGTKKVVVRGVVGMGKVARTERKG